MARLIEQYLKHFISQNMLAQHWLYGTLFGLNRSYLREKGQTLKHKLKKRQIAIANSMKLFRPFDNEVCHFSLVDLSFIKPNDGSMLKHHREMQQSSARSNSEQRHQTIKIHSTNASVKGVKLSLPP